MLRAGPASYRPSSLSTSDTILFVMQYKKSEGEQGTDSLLATTWRWASTASDFAQIAQPAVVAAAVKGGDGAIKSSDGTKASLAADSQRERPKKEYGDVPCSLKPYSHPLLVGVPLSTMIFTVEPAATSTSAFGCWAKTLPGSRHVFKLDTLGISPSFLMVPIATRG
jgi:hypothetical protein